MTALLQGGTIHVLRMDYYVRVYVCSRYYIRWNHLTNCRTSKQLALGTVVHCLRNVIGVE